MKSMEPNEFLCINNIIYQIYNITDFRAMRIAVLDLLKTLIPTTCSSSLMADHSDSPSLLCDPICLPQSFAKVEESYLKIEEQDYSRWVMLSNQAMAIRATDLMTDEKRVETPIYKNLYSQYNFHYTLELSVVSHARFLGIFTLYRTREEGDFTDDEVFMVRAIGQHLNARFHDHYEAQNASGGKLTSPMIELINQYHLTNRESEVLQLIFKEKNNEEISEELCISTHTLKKHIQNLYRKFSVSSRWELMSFRPGP